jgi:hypothetical protein
VQVGMFTETSRSLAGGEQLQVLVCGAVIGTVIGWSGQQYGVSRVCVSV